MVLKKLKIVATVLTVYGIETFSRSLEISGGTALQQYLPFTVLKHNGLPALVVSAKIVATVLTVYGIETIGPTYLAHTFLKVATVLTVYGIETNR